MELFRYLIFFLMLLGFLSVLLWPPALCLGLFLRKYKLQILCESLCLYIAKDIGGIQSHRCIFRNKSVIDVCNFCGSRHGVRSQLFVILQSEIK